MKFPFDHGSGRTPADEVAPDVTSDVLGRLGLTSAGASSPRSPSIGFLRRTGRIQFVGLLGVVVLGSVLWRAFSASDESFVLVETVPRTIENGRESRALLFMGFMSPFEEIGRAITEVDDVRSSNFAIEGIGSFSDEPDSYGATNQGLDAPTSVDILEASAPFPNS